MGIRDQFGAISTNFLTAATAYSEHLAKAAQGDSGNVVPDSQPPVDAAEMDARALMWDPFAIVEQLGFKDRPSAITYGTLQQIVQKVPLVQAIIVTRLNQIAAFARPKRDKFSPGFRVMPVEDDVELTAVDRKFSRNVEAMLMTTGVTDYALARDPFPTFIRKIGRDSLTYDQYCYEVVPNRKGQPAKFQAVDASTIRLADTVNITYVEDPDLITTVQVYDNMVINEWRRHEMAFNVRNPHTNIRLYGYGYSEIEMLINAITSWLWGFDYNSKFFNQGTVAKGLLNIQGTMNQTQLKAFRRQWYQMVSGVENAWRSPVLNSDGKVEWVNMTNTNRDMEFSAWMDFLIKLVSGIYQIDPMELNFRYGNQGQDKAMFESGTHAKLTASKDKGLKPLLQHIADSLTSHIIQPIDKDWKFEFVGLEEETKDELATLNQKRVKTTHTLNELRAEQDLPPDPYGDVILDPAYIQWRSGQEQMKMAQEQGAMPGNFSFPNGGGEDEAPDEFAEEDFQALGQDGDGEEVEKSIRLEVEV
jgi:hypothetical protein